MENGDKRIQYQKVKMVPYLDKSGIFLLAFPACECEWAQIMTTHISKCTLVCMSPWHRITGSHTCVSCTSPLSPGLHSAVYWLWRLPPPALGPIHDLVPSGAAAVWYMENASLPSFTVLQESRGGLLMPWGEEFFQILPLCFPLPKTTRIKWPGFGGDYNSKYSIIFSITSLWWPRLCSRHVFVELDFLFL